MTMLTHFLAGGNGSITFFTGPMACGKTLELVRHLQIFQEQRIPLICLRPQIDTRTPTVQSRAGVLHDAVAVATDDLTAVTHLIADKQVIGLDEAQLFPATIADLLLGEVRRGKTVLVSGLDTDFRGALFPTSLAIMAIPETVVQRSRAVCSVCRRYNATRTQRLRDGKPVSTNDPLVLIEGSQSNVTYEARCLEHHELPTVHETVIS